jgi:ABC-2 type transport system ATP-binding protein
VVLEVDGGSRLAPALLRELEEADLPVAAVEIARPTLDDVFLNLTGRSLRDAAASEPAATQEVPA